MTSESTVDVMRSDVITDRCDAVVQYYYPYSSGLQFLLIVFICVTHIHQRTHSVFCILLLFRNYCFAFLDPEGSLSATTVVLLRVLLPVFEKCLRLC